MNLTRIALDSRKRAVSGGNTAVVVVVLIMMVGATYLYVSPKVSSSASTIPTREDTYTSFTSGAALATATSTTNTLNPNAVQVVIADDSGENDDGGTRFDPQVITVVIGVNNTVTWTNQDSIPHNVQGDSGSFFSTDLSTGQSYSFTFTRAGTYPFHCTYYPIMSGVVTVVNP